MNKLYEDIQKMNEEKEIRKEQYFKYEEPIKDSSNHFDFQLLSIIIFISIMIIIACFKLYFLIMFILIVYYLFTSRKKE